MNDIPRASVKQLAHKIKGFAKHPRMAFFLGAGASRQSGIITASEMIRVFKERIFTECCPAEITKEEEREHWLSEQSWYKSSGSEYSKLFQQFEPKEIGRQRYIESIVEGFEPSLGYVVLANLIASNYVNTVITTNFDDLIYGACTGYTGIRPIVYAYGVLASEMRITADRPKILKLHGDFLYSALKNTDVEIAAQDPNMARQLTQVLSEYGLIVVGYSGGDESVMKILSTISEKNDIYWCVKKGETPKPAIHQLLIEKGGFLVEIDGFDELMSETREIVGFDVSKMFGSIQERQDQIIEKLKNFASQGSVDMLSEVVEALQNQAKLAAEGQQQIKKIQSLDVFTKASKAYQDRDWPLAEKMYREVIRLTPLDKAAHVNLGVVMQHQGKHEEAIKHFRQAIKIDQNYALPYMNLARSLSRLGKKEEAEVEARRGFELDPKQVWSIGDLVLLLRSDGRYAEALELAQKGLKIEPKNAGLLLSLADIYRKTGDTAQAEKYAQQVRDMASPEGWYNLACIEAISGNADKAFALLTKAATTETFDANWATRDPDFDNIRNDPRFKSVIASATKSNDL